MSNCGFWKVRYDLKARFNIVDNKVNGCCESAIPEHEVKDFRQLIEDIVDWLRNMNLLDDYGELNEDELSDVCSVMMKDETVC